MKMKEEWKTIKNFEGSYEVSSKGRVRSLERWIETSDGKRMPVKAMVLNPSFDRGYPQVCLSHNKKQSTQKVHRLVARNHIPNPLNKGTINHIDGNKKNNNVENLEWVTQKENVHHAMENGLRRDPYGEQHHQSILTEKEVLEIRRIFSGSKNAKTQKEVAAEFGVSKGTISAIVNNRNWKHLVANQQKTLTRQSERGRHIWRGVKINLNTLTQV